MSSEKMALLAKSNGVKRCRVLRKLTNLKSRANTDTLRLGL
jgi:hypothetical protein